MITGNSLTKLWRLLPAAIWMGLVFYLSSVPELELQGEWSIYDFALRKLAHVFEYTVLYLLVFWGWRPYLTRSQNLKLSLVIALIYAAVDEFHQSLVPTRDGKLTDVLIDSSGIAIGVIVTAFKTKHA